MGRVGYAQNVAVTNSPSPSSTNLEAHHDNDLLFHHLHDRALTMGMLLSIAAAILVIAGIITLLSGSVIAGVVLIVIGCIVGPGGYSISRR